MDIYFITSITAAMVAVRIEHSVAARRMHNSLYNRKLQCYLGTYM